LMHILHALEQTQPGGETALGPIWHDVAGQVRRRGMVVILSDCFEEIGALTRALRHLRHKKHEVLLFHILAPEEIEFPFTRWTQFRNLEVLGDRMLADPQRLRRDYLKNFRTFCDELRARARGMNVDYHLLRTDEPAERALGLYLTTRQRRK